MKRIYALIITFVFVIFTFGYNVLAQPIDSNTLLNETANYLLNTVNAPSIGSVGGEWTVLGLARSGIHVPDNYFDNYYNNAVQEILNSSGELSSVKYTEYSRLVLALSAIGKDVTNVGGYNLLEKLSDFNSVKKQGINGESFALIALDSKNYDIPAYSGEGIIATRKMLVNDILSREIKGGGFSLSGDAADPDITAMALQALSRYRDQDAVSQVIDRGVLKLSQMQKENGGFESYDSNSLESIAQVILGLSTFKIDCTTDARFIKSDAQGNQKCLIDALNSYKTQDGGFSHVLGGETDCMATEQAVCALAALKRYTNGENSFYDLTDVKTEVTPTPSDSEVEPIPTDSNTLMFSDIETHWAKEAILNLASKQILSGMGDNRFEPDLSMTRAQFATILVKALGLNIENDCPFEDCKSSDWFYGYVASASKNGLILGKSSTEFRPNDLVSREEASVMIDRAAANLGFYQDLYNGEAKDILCIYDDYTACSDWSLDAFARNVNIGLISSDNTSLRPKDNISRAEVAVMVYRLLDKIQMI